MLDDGVHDPDAGAASAAGQGRGMGDGAEVGALDGERHRTGEVADDAPLELARDDGGVRGSDELG
jgi:hypothetical protein